MRLTQRQDDLLWIGGAVLTGLLLFALIAGAVILAKTEGCHRSGEELNVPAEYRVFAGCFFTLPDGEVVPQENYRIIERNP